MAEHTGIEWCDATFNPWWGCERVSPACAHCYADTLSKRYAAGKQLWGDGHDFRFFGDKHWAEPLKWARLLPGKLGRRPRVFCASMADVFEERPELDEHRARLFDLIEATPELDWLILTKRAQEMHDRYYAGGWTITENLWLGVSIENSRYTWRADVLREIPAAVRFISAEPLLGSLYDGRRNGNDCPAESGLAADGVVAAAVRGGRGHEDVSGVREADDGVREEREISGVGLRAAAHGDVHDDRLRDGALPAPQRVGRAPLDLTGIEWVIAGGESGPRARPSPRRVPLRRR